MKVQEKHEKDSREFLPGALIEIDIAEQKVIYMNRMAFHLFGYQASEIGSGIPVGDIFLNDSEFQHAKQLTQSFAMENVAKKTAYIRIEDQELYDFWFKRVDGSGFCGACQGSFILNDARVPTGINLYIRDLTDQKNTELALQQSEAKYRTLVENSTDLIFLVDEQGTILSINQAAAKSVGAEAKAVQGKNISSIFPEKIAGAYQASIKNVFLTGKNASYESIFGSGDHKIWIDTTLNPVKNTQGVVTAVSGVSRDITERKEAEFKIEASDRLRELLLDVVTHDLKTPASVIYGLADMAREYLPEDEVIESIFLSSQRLLAVLENTTILSRAVFGEKIPKSTLVLHNIIEEIGNDFAPQLENAGMSLEIDVPVDIKIIANPLIGEVFKNYISNAIKYAGDGQRIAIEAIEENGSVMVGVKDYGRTIPPEKRSYVFERGSQLAKTKKSGRGLGLAIVKRIAQAHEGDVGVEANEPTGNIFYLRLPQENTVS